MKKYILPIALVFTIFTSCKTDFDLNAPYKETVVIYGLLNSADDSAQYIRISKAFLGEGNALVMAQQPDSINYADILDVQMAEELNGIVQNTFQLERIDTIPKDAGLFAYPYQVYYRLNNHKLNPASLYRLTVRNKQSGYVASSLTRIVKDLNPLVDIVNPSPVPTTDFSAQNMFSVRFNSPVNARHFDLVIRFHYTEISLADSSRTYHYVDWNFPDQFISTNSSVITFPYYRPDFYVLLANQIKVNPLVTRLAGNAAAGYPAIEFRIIAGTEDVSTYFQLTSPSNAGIQDPPLFTTVENGVGLFSSRLIHSEFRDLTNASALMLTDGNLTKDLF